MNENTASIARNTKAMMGSQIITWISSFVLVSFLPRYMGAEGYGKLYVAIAINAIAGLFLDLGFTQLVVKEIARDKSKINSLLVNGVALRVVAWSLSLVLTMGYVVLAHYPRETVNVVFVLAIANLFSAAYDVIHRVFNGLERLEYRSIGLIVEKVFLSLVGVTLLLLGMGPVAIAVVMLLSVALNFAVSVFLLRRITKIHIKVTPSTWKPLLHQGFPFLVASTFGFIYYRIDVMMLASMSGDVVVGWYGAPYKLFDTLMFFPMILNTAVYPVLSRLMHTSKTSMDETSRNIFNLTFIVAVPVAVGVGAFSKPIISMLFGLQEYSNSIILLQILSISLLLIYTDFVLNTVLTSHDKQKQLSYAAMVATVINIGVNYGAIRYFQTNYGNGAIGAALTTGLTEICVMSMSIYLLPKGIFTASNLLVALKTLIGGALMWATIWSVQLRFPHALGWIIAGIAGFLVYLLMLVTLKVVSKRELNFLLHLLPFRKQVAITSE